MYFYILQLSMLDPSAAQVRHPHNLDYQTRPTSKVLRSLPCSRFRIILLPSETRLLPLVEDILNKIFS